MPAINVKDPLRSQYHPQTRPLSVAASKISEDERTRYSLLQESHEGPNLLGEVSTDTSSSILMAQLSEVFAIPQDDATQRPDVSLADMLPLARELVQNQEANAAIVTQLEKCVALLTGTAAQMKMVSSENKLAILTETAGKVAEEVYQLPVGKSYFIPFACEASKCSQKLFFEFSRTVQGTFDLRIWSTGVSDLYWEDAPLSNLFYNEYQTVKIENGNVKPFPTLQFKGIPSEELFFKLNGEIQSDFFQALIEPQVMQTAVGADYLMKGVLKYLWSYHQQADLVPQTRSAGKNLESYLWEPLKTIFAFNICDKRQYRLDKIKLMTRCLCEAWAKSALLDQTTFFAEQLRHLIKRCAKQLRMVLLSTLSAGLISEEEVKTYRVSASDVEQRLEVIEELANCQKSKQQKSIQVELVAKRPAIRPVILKVDHSIPAEILEKKRQAVRLKSLEEPLDATALSSKLAEIVLLVSNEHNQSELADFVGSQIECVVHALPLVQSVFWDQIPDHQLKEVLGSLDALLDIYHLKTVDTKTHSQMQESVTVEVMYSLVHRLALLYEQKVTKKPLLENFQVYFDHDSQDILEIYFDQSLYDKRQQVLAYFRSCQNESNTKPIFRFNKEKSLSDPDAEFYRLMGQLYPSLSQDVESWFMEVDFNRYKDSDIAYIMTLKKSALVSQFYKRQRCEADFERERWEKPEEKIWQVHKKSDFWDSKKYSYSHYWQGRRVGLEDTFSREIVSKEVTYGSNVVEFLIKKIIGLGFENERLLDDGLNHVWSTYRMNYSPKDLMISLCEPTLFIQKLFKFFNFEQLKQHQEQAIFEGLFFRAHFKADDNPLNCEHSLPIRTFLSTSYMKEECKKFITSGLEYYTNTQNKEKISIKGWAFILRFACFLHSYQAFDASVFHDIVNGWLKINGLHETHELILHHHRLFLNVIANGNPLDGIESWFHIQKHRNHLSFDFGGDLEDQAHPYVFAQAGRCAQECLSQVKDYLAVSFEPLARKVLKINDENTRLELSFVSEGVISVKDGDSAEWYLNLSSGTIFTVKKSKKATISLVKDIVEHTELQRAKLPTELDFGKDLIQAEDGSYYFKDLPDYILQTDQPRYILGNIDEYSLLKHRHTGHYKVLMPARSLLRTGSSEKPWTFSKDVKSPNHFVTLDWDGSQLIPHTAEEKIFLAYCHLSQQHYRQAWLLLQSFESSERLSQKSQDYMLLIYQFVTEQDTSPEATTIGFKTLSFLSNNQFTANDSFLKRFLNNLKLSNLEFELELSEERDIWEKDRANRTWNDKRNPLDARIKQRLIHLSQKLNKNVVVNYPANIKGLQKAGEHYPGDCKNISFNMLPGSRDCRELFDQLMFFNQNFDETLLAEGFPQRVFNALNLKDIDPAQKKRLFFKLNVLAQSSDTIKKAGPHLKLLLNDIYNRQKILVQNTGTIERSEKHLKVKAKKSIKPHPIRGIAHKTNDFILDNLVHPLQIVYDKYFLPMPSEDKTTTTSASIPCDGNLLKDLPRDKIHILQQEFKEFQNDFQHGVKANLKIDQQLNMPPLRENEIEQYDLAEMQKLIVRLEQEAESTKINMLNLAQKSCTEKERLMRAVEYRHDLQLEDLHLLFVQANHGRYHAANLDLTDEEIHQLHNLMAQYIAKVRDGRRLQRISTLMATIKKVEHDSKEFHELRQKIYDLRPLYQDHEYPLMLFYEYMSELDLRPDQVPLLQHLLRTNQLGRYINSVVQFKPGGGKTTIFLALLANAAAQPGRISAVIVPKEQLETVKANFGKTQRQYYDQKVEVLEYQDSDLVKKEVVEEIVKRLKKACLLGSVVLMPPQIVEFLWAINLRNCAEQNDTEYLAIAAEAFNLMIEKMDVLGDEVDQLLNLNYAVHITGGKADKVLPFRVLLVEEIFKTMISEEIFVENAAKESVSLKQFTGIVENKQKYLDENDRLLISNIVSRHLAKNYPALYLIEHEEHHESFVRYVTNKMSPILQSYLDKPEEHQEAIQALAEEDAKDLAFLQYVRRLRGSSHYEEAEAAHEIALVRHFFKVVLPETFAMEGGRHYGRDYSNVRPFVAAGIPATTEFGYHYKKLLLWYQHINQFKLENMHEFATKMEDTARIDVRKTKLPINETAAGQEFHKVTGLSIDAYTSEKHKEKALAAVNQDLNLRMRVDREVAMKHVMYYLHRYSANGLTLAKLLSTFRSFSGTPWNYLTYASKLVNQVLFSVGTEGEILDRLLQREEKGNVPFHLVENTDPLTILKKIIPNHPQKERIRGFLEGGAFFKELPNNEIPQVFWDFFHPKEEEDKPVAWDVKAIFYLHNPGGGKPPIPYLLRQGEKGIERVPLTGTREEDFLQAGVKPEECFFLINEKGCTGTDVPQIPDAINLMTMDENMLRRTMFQTILRLRQFLTTQNIEPVILEDHHFPKENGTTDLRKIISLYVKNQGLELSKRIAESFQYQIDFAIEFEIVKTFLLDPVKEGKKPDALALSKFKEYLRTKTEDNPYDDFGALDESVDTKNDLEEYIQSKLKALEKHELPIIYTKVKPTLDELSELIKNSEKIMPQRSKGNTQNINLHTNVLNFAHAHVNTQQKIETDVNSHTELRYYEEVKSGQKVDEREWTGDEVQNLLNTAAETGLQGYKDVFSLHDALDEEISNLHYTYALPYKYAVKKNHFTTYNFLHTCEKRIPIFSSHHKSFSQILVIKKGDSFEFLQLSQHEAAAFKKYLEKEYDKHPSVWLLEPHGVLYLDNPHQPLPKHREITEILIESNALSGNMEYLDEHEEETFAWVIRPSDFNNEAESYALRRHLVMLKTARQEWQKKYFFNSEVFQPAFFNNKYAKKLREMNSQAQIDNLNAQMKQWEKPQPILPPPTPLEPTPPSQSLPLVQLATHSRWRYILTPLRYMFAPIKFLLVRVVWFSLCWLKNRLWRR